MHDKPIAEMKQSICDAVFLSTVQHIKIKLRQMINEDEKEFAFILQRRMNLLQALTVMAFITTRIDAYLYHKQYVALVVPFGDERRTQAFSMHNLHWLGSPTGGFINKGDRSMPDWHSSARFICNLWTSRCQEEEFRKTFHQAKAAETKTTTRKGLK